MSKRWLLLGFVIVACGDDPESSSDATTAADTTAAETSGDTGEPDAETSAGCDHNGFVAVASDAGQTSSYFLYLAQSSLGAPVSTLNFELVPAQGGATAPGSYTLTEGDYATCGNCVLTYLDCDDNLANCDKTFLARAGTLTIATFGASGGTFAGALHDVELIEVTVDDQLRSTPVVGGQTWCISHFEFEAPVQ